MLRDILMKFATNIILLTFILFGCLENNSTKLESIEGNVQSLEVDVINSTLKHLISDYPMIMPQLKIAVNGQNQYQLDRIY